MIHAAVPTATPESPEGSQGEYAKLQKLEKVLPSLLNSPQLRFVCEDERSGVEEGQNRLGS